MKMSLDPRLPIFGGRDYERSLYQRLYALFREIAQGFNGHDDAILTLQEDLGSLGEVLANLQWLGQPIGVPVPIWTHIPGVSEPPADSALFRYVKLSASDSYNDGALTGESVSGSAPLVTATAVVDFDGSPINGQTVALINTERTILRPGDSGTLQDDSLQNITGQFPLRAVATGASMGGGASGAFANPQDGSSIASVATGTNQTAYTYSFDASRVARTDNETRMRNRGATYYMRIA